MVGARGFEPPTSWSQTIPNKAMGLTLVNLSDAYLQDRINTKGLTPFGIQTIREHFRILLNFYLEHFPNSPELSAFLGTKTPATRRSLLGTYRAFGKWLEKKHIMPNPWADIEMPKVPLPLLPAPTPEEVFQNTSDRTTGLSSRPRRYVAG